MFSGANISNLTSSNAEYEGRKLQSLSGSDYVRTYCNKAVGPFRP